MSTSIPAVEFHEPGGDGPEPSPAPEPEFPRLVGLRDIADMLQVEPRTPTVWRDRSRKGQMHPPLPDPELFVSGRPVWSKKRILRWAEKTGRLPEQRAARQREMADAS